MKTKRRIAFVAFFICLLTSLFLFGFSTRSLIARAAEDSSSTETTDEAEVIAEETNKTIKDWISTIFGGASTLFSGAAIVLLSKKNKQSVAVTVNDSQTQTKLEELTKAVNVLQDVALKSIDMNKGMFSIFEALYAENKSLDKDALAIIKNSIGKSKEIGEAVQSLFDSNLHKDVKQALNELSNIVLG